MLKKGKINPVAKSLAKLNYNAGVHEKTHKAKRIKEKQKLLKSLSRSFDSYLMSLFSEANSLDSY
ncbi:hypothetical protein [Cysteiniphilum sp. QT6929]|uniref:hypothetical protein n=1 Tax=Cysteiniphilum sp. QT6929 TaxID=2975055 RepID=UPI0024B3A8F6|nr:hypothetical protein [Cysteiniphilum sp. QT6929]WHN65203.1 hypothetical protein NYP54_09150 [Cysteiniphilum sp. QT6929]